MRTPKQFSVLTAFHWFSNLSFVAFFGLIVALFDPPAHAQQLTARDLLPDSTVIYIEVPKPSELTTKIENHLVRDRLTALPEYQKLIKTPDFAKFQIGVALIEAQMEMSWQESIAAIGKHGIFMALDAKTEGTALLAHADKLDTLVKLRKTLFAAVQSSGKSTDSIKKGEYRGVTAYEINGAQIAALDNWLLVTNKSELGKRIIDQFKDGGTNRLAKNEAFEKAIASRLPGAAWMYVDIEKIRNSGRFPQVYSGITENLGAEVILGGLSGVLKHTSHATASLSLEPSNVNLVVSMPHEATWTNENRAYFFGVDNSGQAPALLKLDSQIASLSSYRDLSQMWLRAGDLVTEKAVEQQAAADSQLTTFFSGKDFGEDILGALEPELQLIVARQDPQQLKPTPAVKLPAFAWVAKLKDPEKTQPEFRRVFQSFIGFFNITGATQGQPQFDMDMLTEEDVRFVTAKIIPEQREKDSTAARVNFNFSPTIAFKDNRMVLSSSLALAKEVFRAPIAAPVPKSDHVRNTQLEIQPSNLEAVLRDNLDQLVAQNMLEKGHSKQAAEGEIGVLLSLIQLFQSGQMELVSQSSELKLSAQLDFTK